MAAWVDAPDLAPAQPAPQGAALAPFAGAVSNSRDALQAIRGRRGSVSRQERLLDGPGERAAGPGRSSWLAAGQIHRGRVPDAPEVAALQLLFDGHLLVAGACLAGPDAAREVFARYRRDGADGFATLEGNYAFALLDPRGALWLVRDAAGSKPLFLHRHEDSLVFGSSAAEVARLAGRVRAEPSALREFLVSGRAPVHGETMFAGVAAVPAGTALGWREAGGAPEVLQQRPVFDDGAQRELTLADAGALLRELLERSVGAATHGGRTAVALSGGLDSSALLAAACAAGRRPPRCISYHHARDDLPAAWDERGFAQSAAAQCGAPIDFVSLSATQLAADFSRVAQAQDFPFGSPVVVAQAALFRAAADAGALGILGGHGPDALFGGGDSHLAARAADLLAHGRLVAALRLLAGARQHASIGAVGLLRATVAHGVPTRWRARRAGAAPPWIRAGSLPAMREADAAADHGSRLTRQVVQQLYASVLPGALLAEECNARAAGLDNHLPFLSRAVLQLAARLRPEAIVSPGGVTKPLLRLAFDGRLPASILSRRRAVGFAVPVLPWLRELGEWSAERLARAAQLPFHDGPGLETLRATLQGDDIAAWRTAFIAWRWISLVEWADAHGVEFG